MLKTAALTLLVFIVMTLVAMAGWFLGQSNAPQPTSETNQRVDDLLLRLDSIDRSLDAMSERTLDVSRDASRAEIAVRQFVADETTMLRELVSTLRVAMTENRDMIIFMSGVEP
ncbi:hypothetical protein CMI37_20290 [Candidatus Pacearchaeota archaeon]|nr:hypothetical protein [Candidatus Pacearchaeota archaeon]|tara:strand:- start:888 stop:1229 length:342 start_codon:yes stop_codon:yes gene_type:complete